MTLITIALGVAVILGVVLFIHEKKRSKESNSAEHEAVPESIRELHQAEDEQYP